MALKEFFVTIQIPGEDGPLGHRVWVSAKKYVAKAVQDRYPGAKVLEVVKGSER